jgi:hypothetical protein
MANGHGQSNSTIGSTGSSASTGGGGGGWFKMSTVAIALAALLTITFVAQLGLLYHGHSHTGGDTPHVVYHRQGAHGGSKLPSPSVQIGSLRKKFPSDITRQEDVVTPTEPATDPGTQAGTEAPSEVEQRHPQAKVGTSQPLQTHSSVPSKTQPADSKVGSGPSSGGAVVTASASASATPTAQVRVGIIVVYVGTSLPAWFDAFAQTAAYSDGPNPDNDVIFEWLLFVTKIPPRHTPKNVKIIQLSDDDLFAHFAKLVDTHIPTEQEFVNNQKEWRTNKRSARRPIARLGAPYGSFDTVGVIRHLLTSRSYLMVEFKPTFGFLFAAHLAPYTHWAYADIDQLVGRLNPLITTDMLQQHDIYTSTFGDNFRLYMRGQLTIHKNTHIPTNILWRGCEHFTNFGTHLVEYLASDNKTWGFESAEGCYSKVVSDAIMNKHPYIPRAANKHSVSVYFAATQATDAFGAPFTDRESVLLNKHLMRCYTQPLGVVYTEQTAYEDHKTEYVLCCLLAGLCACEL